MRSKGLPASGRSNHSITSVKLWLCVQGLFILYTEDRLPSNKGPEINIIYNILSVMTHKGKRTLAVNGREIEHPLC